MVLRRLIPLACALLASGCTQRGNPTPSPIVAKMDSVVPGSLARYGVPSIAIGYVHNGALELARVYGERAAGVPADTQTVYNIASLTKPVFAELVLRLVAAGKLSLDEPMYPVYVDPDIADDPRHKLLTLRIALSHRTGFANWRRETGGKLQFTFDPGTKYKYSGEGFEYASHYVQRKLGKSLEELAQEYVFVPLGMKNTSFIHRKDFDNRVALPKGSKGFGESSFDETGNAADDIHTTVGDYSRFLIGVMNHSGYSAALAAVRDSMHALDTNGGPPCDSKVSVCPVREGYGIGWSMVHYPNDRVLWHTGSDNGEKAMVFYFPDKRDGVVMFTNGHNGFQPMIDVGLLLFPNRAFAGYLRSGKQ